MVTSQNRYQTKEEYVYHVLRDAILTVDLRPGDKLVMDRISEDLGTSPIPIRSALQRLQAEGLVEITPHAGAVVSAVSLSEIDEIFTMLEALERTAYRVAANSATEDDIRKLDGIITRMDSAMQIENTRLWSDLNIEFHLLVAEITGMDLMVEFTRRTMDKWIRLSRCYFGQIGSLRMEVAQSEHHQILENLKRGSTNALEDLAIRHNRQAYQVYQELIERENIG